MYSKKLISILTFLATVFVLYVLYKQLIAPTGAEGFTQNSMFVLEQDGAIYDSFYVDVYDKLMLSEQRSNSELKQVIEMTQPSVKYSTFLDIGCGTGHAVKYLSDLGYVVYGCDKSTAMIEKALTNATSVEASVSVGDVLNPMLYDRNMFTHILCTYYTIYEINDKRKFFKNCYYWMKPGAYLILHLVDEHKYSPIIPAGRPLVVDNIQSYSNRRITDTIIDFTDFKYVANHTVNTSSVKDSDSVIIKQEAFTDKISGAVRQNEQVLYMESIEEILKLSIRCGFLIKGKAVLSPESCGGDKHQYLYILERTL